MDNEFEEDELVFRPGNDYFTLNDCAFFRIIKISGNMFAASLFCLNDNKEYEEIESGIYPMETVKDALLWDEEPELELEFK